MLKRALVFTVAICAAASSFAGPKPIYVSWIPGTSALAAGSKPTIRITLDVAPQTDTAISISTSDETKVSLPGSTVLAMAGQRYVTFPVTLNGVDENASVTVSATSDGVTVLSPAMTITASYPLRMTFNTQPTSNVIRPNTLTELKFTLSGPAGPSGYGATGDSISFTTGTTGMGPSAFYNAITAGGGGSVTIPYGSSIFRAQFLVPTFNGSNTGSWVQYMWQSPVGGIQMVRTYISLSQ